MRCAFSPCLPRVVLFRCRSDTSEEVPMHGHKRLAASLVLVVGALVSGVFTYAAGDWNTARSNFEQFKGGYENLRRLTPEETRRVVTAICNCDEDERVSVADDA